ncbi:hypothetical protein WUBG_02224, partial [Wuchereria bancrofti]
MLTQLYLLSYNFHSDPRQHTQCVVKKSGCVLCLSLPVVRNGWEWDAAGHVRVWSCSEDTWGPSRLQ